MPNDDRSFASVFYDADCQFCVNAARRFERVLARRRFELVPLQVPGASAKFGVRDDQLLAEMRLRLRRRESVRRRGGRCGDCPPHLVGVAALGVEPITRRDATDACHVPVDRPPSELRE